MHVFDGITQKLNRSLKAFEDAISRLFPLYKNHTLTRLTPPPNKCQKHKTK